MAISFRIRQENQTVAQTSGDRAEAEIWNYAFQYRQDGDLTIQHNAQGHWKRFAFLVKWPS